MTTPVLYDLVNPKEPQAVVREATEPLVEVDPLFNAERIRQVYADIVRLFQGRYPGYHASDAWYHDLEHTNAVFLCVAGMLHGAYRKGIVVSTRGKELALMAALFHDVGLIRREGEGDGGTGAQFTVDHELRSIGFMEQYLAAHGVSAEDRGDCGHMIACTNLTARPEDIPFRSEEVRMLGRMLGSADLIAQMSDRAYLEKLLLLYREFQEARLPGFDSELELLEKTPEFYERVVKARLAGTLEDAEAFLESHARARWRVDRDPYRCAIERNLEYLARILAKDKSRYRERLRRGGIVERLPAT